MINNYIFTKNNSNFENFDNKTNTLTIKDINEQTIYLTFDNYIPDNFNIEIINSNVIIIENYKGSIEPSNFSINVDCNSKLNRLSILVEINSSLKIIRNINNNGFYQSMQIDLTDYNVDSTENINLKTTDADAYVIDGIYAINNVIKKYQTNLNHYVSACNSKAQIFAINNDKAHVSIFTDAYIKNGAIGTKTTQEGRIINLSSTCSGIVLPNLHIDENDVEASHSCSVGSLNQEHMYYLESRGLSKIQARNILIRGYFNPIIENITNDTIKEELIRILEQRIG